MKTKKPKEPNPHIVKVLIEWMDERSRNERLYQKWLNRSDEYGCEARKAVYKKIALLNEAIHTVAMGVRGIETRLQISAAIALSRKGAKS